MSDRDEMTAATTGNPLETLSQDRPSTWRHRLREKAPGSFLLILALAFGLFAVALLCLPAQYETNDDAAMNMYAAGKNLGQSPSEFLLFQHFVIGLGLKFLYSHIPTIPWYGAFLYLYLFIGSVVIGYVVSRFRSRLSAVGFWVVLFFLFYLRVIVGLQFTICAGYLAIAGILLLYSVIQKPLETKRSNWCLIVFAVGLLLWAGLVRYYSLLLAVLSLAPLLGYAVVTRFRASWRCLLPVLGCVVLASVFLNWTQLFYYKHSPGWERFYSYNNVRADFIDRHKITWDEGTEPSFQHIGWSRNDLAMLTSWFYLDPKVYSFRNLSYISKNTAVLPKPTIAWSALFSDLRDSLMSYGGLGALLLCVLVFMKTGRTMRGFAVLALLWYGVLFIGVTIVERHLPVRVWLVMLCGLYVTELIFWCSLEPRRPVQKYPALRLAISFLVFACFALFCLGQTSASRNISGNIRFYQKKFRADLAQLKPRADQLYVTWGGDFPYQSFQLPLHSTTASEEMQFLGLGVGNHEPVVQNRLRAFGIKDLYQAFYRRNDIFLICIQAKKPLLAQYIEEHYHTKVVVTTVFKGKTFLVCKVSKVS